MNKSATWKLINISCKSNTAEITGYTFPPCWSPSDHLPDSDMNLWVNHTHSHITVPGRNRNIGESKVQIPLDILWGGWVWELQRYEKAQKKESSPWWLEQPPAPAGTAPLHRWRIGETGCQTARQMQKGLSHDSTAGVPDTMSPPSMLNHSATVEISDRFLHEKPLLPVQPSWKATRQSTSAEGSCAGTNSTVGCPGPNAREQTEMLPSVPHGDVSLLSTYWGHRCPNILGHYEYPAQSPDHNLYWVPPGKDTRVLQCSIRACLGLWPRLNTPPDWSET